MENVYGKKFESLVKSKLTQWEGEASISAARAMQAGVEAKLVVYPSGLKMMRFSEPFKEYGMHYEVAPEVWERIKANGGKVSW